MTSVIDKQIHLDTVDVIPEAFWDQALLYKQIMTTYYAAIKAVQVKLEVLNDELSIRTSRSPIEFIKSRLKRSESIVNKLDRYGFEKTLDNLYLFHDVNSYELKFVTNSSLEIDSIIVKRNEEDRTPTPSLDSKYFVGWYLDQDFKTKLGYLEYGKSYTVYARWFNPSYFIYYHNSGGIEATEIKAGFGPEVTNQTPYKAGYYFNGWVDEEGNPFWSTLEPHYDDIHLYATFERELINISLMDNNDKWYSISGRYEDSLADLVDKVPGMKIKAFYSDSSFTNKLSLDTLIYSTKTFYVDIEAIPVPIILLEEILSASNAKFSLVNDYLLVENDNNIYFYNYYKKGLLDD